MERPNRRYGIRYGVLTLLAALLMHTVRVRAQDPSVSQTVENALHQMSDLAGIIFAGEVIAIRHREGVQGASGVVEVDFRIDQAVRGCSSGGSFTLREWAGLWQGGDERYHVGQRFLMMLHSPGSTGMTSPVADLDGAIPLHAQSPPIASSTSIPLDSPASLAADLRWVETHVLRTVPSPATSQATRMTVDAMPVADAQRTSLPAVLEMLSAWNQSSGQQNSGQQVVP